MKIKLIIIAMLGLLASTSTTAWDEVTHGFMTDKIIQEINIPELQQLLERNKNEFLAGSWFTDTYQYTPNRYETLNPHNLDVHCNAYLNYLEKEEVKKQDNYEKLVALFLGSLAHTTEDFWLDNILYWYPRSIGENVTGDTYNGVIAINKFNNLTRKVKPYFPSDDFFKMYKEAGVLGENFETPEQLDQYYRKLIAKQYEQMRLLKLLSFLASNQVQNKSPWTTANILTVTGGMLSSVNNSARYIEEVWRALHHQPDNGILNAEYSPLDNRLGLLVSFPVSVPNESQLKIVVLNDERDTLSGTINAFSFGGTVSNLVNLIYKFDNDSTFKTGNYTAIVKSTYSDSTSYSTSFEANTKYLVSNYSQKPKTYLSTFGAGLFLFVLCLGLAGMFWGLAGLVTFSHSLKNSGKKLSYYKLFLSRLVQFIAIAILAIGLYLLATKGWLVVLNV